MRLIAMKCAGLLSTGLLSTGLMVASPAAAQDRETLGYGRLFTNDFFGDNEDRWRSGSYAFSIVRGNEWEGRAPTAPGAILEYRIRSEIIAPETLNGPRSNDRAYVGALSLGVHTHFARGGANISTGLDLVAVGPQTGVIDLQDWFHDVVGAPSVASSVRSNQVSNAVYPTALAEVSYPISIGETATLRPFVEAQYGVEDFVRIGADIFIGETLKNDLWLRDSPSGQLYTGVESGEPGVGFTFGADYAYVDDSEYFPSSFGAILEDERFRARAGVHWRFGDGISYFYGVTYLSEEFVGQSEGQVVGSLKLNFNF